MRSAMGDRGFLETNDSDGVHLSQDSQLSVTSLSQDLSQGSVDADTGVAISKHRRSEKKKKKRSKSEKSSKSRDSEKCERDRSETPDCDNANSGVKHTRKSSKNSSKCDNGERSEKKVKRHSSRRPEPEGGNPSHAETSSILEFERIINNTDPLFSDLELDLPGDEDAKPRRAQRPNRTGPAGGIFIPCTQLGINSNTMIKFAIIGTELQNIFQVSQRVRRQSIIRFITSMNCSFVAFTAFILPDFSYSVPVLLFYDNSHI